jgi:hypothetical protein
MTISTKKQLFLASLALRGWQPKPKPTELRPLWQTIHHAIATIKCARLTCLPLHRRIFCLVGCFPGRYYLVAAIIGTIALGAHFSAPPLYPVYAATKKVCPTLGGKPFCDMPESAKQAFAKKPKTKKLTCIDTGKVDGPEDCEDPSFFVGEGRESLLTETDLDGNLIYSVCHKVYKCKK